MQLSLSKPSRPVAALALSLAALAPSALPQEGSLPDAAQLLDRADAQVADADARDSLRHLVARGTVGAGPMKGTFEELYSGERVKYSAAFGGMSMTQGTDGSMTWSTDPALGIQVAREPEHDPVQRLYAVGRRTPWRELYDDAETVGAVDIDGRRHWELKMTPGCGETEAWFVDAETNLVTRTDFALPDFQGGTLKCEFHFGDWREVDGVLLPHRKNQKIGTYDIEYVYESIELGKPVAAERMAVPEDVLEEAGAAESSTPRPRDAGDCALEHAEERHVATIRVKIAAADMASQLAVILPEVMAHLGRVGASPTGPPFSRFHSITTDEMDLEAGIPVRKPVTPGGRVKASTLPGGKLATTWHIGEFHGLGDTHALLERWMESEGLRSRGAHWEVYWTDPGVEPDSSKWRTQVLWPVQ